MNVILNNNFNKKRCYLADWKLEDLLNELFFTKKMII